MTHSPGGKRLLVCIYAHNTWGGIEIWLDGVAAYLSAHGWEVVIGLARGHRYNDPALVRSRYSRYQTIEIDGRTGTPEGRTQAVQRIIRRIRPDVVMPLGMADVYRAIARCKRDGLQVRLLIAMHAISCELFNDVLRTEAVIDLCVAVNPLQETFLVQSGDFKTDRLMTIVNGVPLPSVQRQLTIRDREPLRILFVGRLSHQHKRVLDLVPLIQEMCRRAANFRLTVVGSGEDEVELRQRLQPHVVTGAVIFTGYVRPEELHRSLYPRHDVLVVLSPTLGEACPLVIQEAMAHGVVPVSSEYLGIHSLGFVRSGQTGYIYPCGELSRAADCLRDLETDSVLLHRMSQACLVAASEFALDIVHQKWLDALDRLVEQPTRRLSKDLLLTGLEPEKGQSRLDRVMSPKWADRVRHLFRRWPNHPDGWAEWPGTIANADAETWVEMMADLHRLDGLAQENRDAIHAEA